MPSSGSGGPCNHCGRTESCCWRRGPPSKPTLCNACGSRYLVKRTLEGYKPLATRGEALKPAKKISSRSRAASPHPESPVSARSPRLRHPTHARPSEGSSSDSGASDMSASILPVLGLPIMRSVQQVVTSSMLKTLKVSAMRSFRKRPRKALHPCITHVM